MKGKQTFTKAEAQEIKKLIRQKIGANRKTQNNIRAKIRSLGFYIRDFTDKKNYTVEDFEKLVTVED